MIEEKQASCGKERKEGKAYNRKAELCDMEEKKD